MTWRKKKQRGSDKFLKFLQAMKKRGEEEIEVRDVVEYVKGIEWSEMEPKTVENRVLEMKKMFKAVLGEELCEEIACIVHGKEAKQLVGDEAGELVGMERERKAKRKREDKEEEEEERLLKKFASPGRSEEQVMQSLEELEKILPFSEHLCVKYVNAVVGLGVFVKKQFKRGEVVCEFEGDFLNEKETEARVEELKRYGIREECMMDVKWSEGRVYILDLTHPKHGFGRLINHSSSKISNIVLKIQADYRKPRKTRFYFVAKKKILAGQELLWNYNKSKKIIHFD